jgi:dihydrofolate reductase
MRLTVTAFITLDGVVQAPGGPDEDTDDGFAHGGWTVPYFDDDLGAAMDGFFAEADAFLLGRRTYEIFAAAWPLMDDPDDPIATKLNRLPKYVASRTLREVTWSGSSLVTGDLAAAVADLKARPGRELRVHGSGGMVQTLLRHRLVDEFRLLTFPIVLGDGKRLFGDGAAPLALTHEHRATTPSGVDVDVYRAAGDPTYGSFGPEYEEASPTLPA